MTLFDITTDLHALNNTLDDNDNRFDDPDVAAAVAAYMAQLLDARAVKLDGYVALIRQLQMESAAMQFESETFAAKAQARENRVKWLKDCLKAHMKATNVTKVSTPKGYTVSVQKNGGKRPLLINENVTADDLPGPFVKTRKEIDTEAVRAALDAGEPLVFASLGEAGTHVRVK